MKTNILAIEAIICSSPCVLLAMGGVPIFIFSGIRMLTYEPIDGLIHIFVALGVVLALCQYALLSVKTIERKKFNFGLLFWLSVPFALIAIRGVFGGFFTLEYAVLIVSPIVFSTIHFAFLQLRIIAIDSQ